jgi:hypothetical protein
MSIASVKQEPEAVFNLADMVNRQAKKPVITPGMSGAEIALMRLKTMTRPETPDLKRDRSASPQLSESRTVSVDSDDGNEKKRRKLVDDQVARLSFHAIDSSSTTDSI